MSDSENQPAVEEIAVETPEVDYKALYEETQKKLETVAAHKDKLYKETKAAKEEREIAKQEAKRIEEEKALKDGEYEKLWQTANKEKDDLNKRLSDTLQAFRNEKIEISALKIANELAEGFNVEILGEFIQKNLTNLADEKGVVEPDVLESVKQEFKNNQKFSDLLKKSKASGGGAPGNKNIAGETSVMKRDAFEKLNPDQRMKYIKSGGSLTD